MPLAVAEGTGLVLFVGSVPYLFLTGPRQSFALALRLEPAE